ncbi:MAG TPA: F0F1 ATP synthase subunit A [Chthoniobacterales bacterium]|nr:F0F1 ATP synthase subunit A [Chthoniobacterales bacterium]
MGNIGLLLPKPNFMVRRFSLFILIALALCASGVAATSAFAAEAAPEVKEEHAIPLKPDVLCHLGPLAVTNSMVVTWIVAAGILICAQLATRKIKPVPSGLQNFWEWLVESLYNFLENMIGRDLVKKTFWFFATIFIFILALNWFGLLPGVGTIGWGHHDPVTGSFHVDRPLFRGAAANLNLTFAMAAVFFVCWIVWALQANGIGGLIMHIFGPKGETTGILKVLMIFIFFIVGWLEVVSILFRPISLSFRLFGNIYAGETMLEAMSHVVPSLAWLIPIPFYFLELLVGFVQALVFMLLTAVFTLLIAQHEPGHGEAAHH